MTLHMVCDTSGSMGEGGKPFIMRMVAMGAAQWLQRGDRQRETRLYGWASEGRVFTGWNPKTDYPGELLVCAGALNCEALIQMLGEKPDGKVLLLTDGLWPHEGARKLRRWKEGLPRDTLRVIKIGADANPQLKGPDVFAAEDFFAAMDGWLEGGTG